MGLVDIVNRLKEIFIGSMSIYEIDDGDCWVLAKDDKDAIRVSQIHGFEGTEAMRVSKDRLKKLTYFCENGNKKHSFYNEFKTQYWKTKIKNKESDIFAVSEW